MRKVDLEQGSEEWLNWRKGLLTATDAPMLLGASPYVTPYKGWQRKVGQAPEQAETEAMRRGRHDEPIARDWFIKEFGIEMEPCCIESESYNYLGASLDGLSKCGKYVLEVKSNNDQYHFGLCDGLPSFHLMQMQHQFLSSDNSVEKGYYVSINKGDKVVKEVYPDPIFQKAYLIKAWEFWKKVVFLEPPEMCAKDYRDKTDSSPWKELAEDYKKICKEIKELEEVKESHRKELIRLCEDENSSGCGLKVFKKTVKGRVNYEAIPELHGIDLEKYRKEPSNVWTILTDRS